MYKTKFKIDRSLGTNVYGLNKSSFCKNRNRPGIHIKRKNNVSYYCKSLNHERHIRAFFRNMKRKQLIKEVKNNVKKNNYKLEIIKSLESRLDTILFRSCVAKYMMSSKNLISHGHVFVNDRKITCPSYKVSNGSKISFGVNADKHIKMNCTSERKVPSHIIINTNKDEKNKINEIVFSKDNIVKCSDFAYSHHLDGLLLMYNKHIYKK